MKIDLTLWLGKAESLNYSKAMSGLTYALIEEIKSPPDPVQREVFDFLAFLKAQEMAKKDGHENLLPLAQSAWGSDWDTPEEDAAWRDL